MTLKEPLRVTRPEPVRAPAASAAPTGRRRPGRPDQVSPNLVPLLRTSPMIEAVPAFEGADGPADDALTPARGIAVGLVLSVPLWAMIGGVVWAML